MDRSLLLVIDVQNFFVNDGTNHVIDPINRLIDRWREYKYPIAFSRFINTKGSPWQTIKHTELARQEPDISLHKDLKVEAGDYIFDKTKYSMWNDELTKLCKKQNIKDVYISGINTDQCVLATAVEVFEHNIRPIVIETACASTRGEDYHRMGLKLLERFIGKEQIIKEL